MSGSLGWDGGGAVFGSQPCWSIHPSVHRLCMASRRSCRELSTACDGAEPPLLHSPQALRSYSPQPLQTEEHVCALEVRT